MNKLIAFVSLSLLVLFFALSFDSSHSSLKTISSSHLTLPSSFITEVGIGTVCGNAGATNELVQAVQAGTGTSPPGCTCKQDSDCSLGKCGCTVNSGGSVCCSRQYGSPCLGNGECASGVCSSSGTCDNTPAGTPKLSNGSKCRNDQECTSGKCAPSSRPGKPNICQ